MMKHPQDNTVRRIGRHNTFDGKGVRLCVSLVLSAFLCLASQLVSAASPLALRVDVVPIAITADGTVATVEVQLAPPDRGRIGRQARMRVKLIDGSKIRAHILQDIDFDSQGLAATEFTWAPGRYQLTLEIESLQGAAKGLWIGEIEIPASLDRAPASAVPLVENPVTTGPGTPTADGPPGGEVRQAEPLSVTPDTPPTHEPPPRPAVEVAVAPVLMEGDPVSPPPVVVPVPTPSPITQTPLPSAATTSSISGPVFALVIDIDLTDDSTADRGSGIRDEIEKHSGGATPIVMQSDKPNPALAIGRAIATLRAHSDARAIVVVTDGRGKASRSDWKRTANESAKDQIPIIVVGIWNQQFDPGTRKQLSRLATESGGSSYLLQPSESPSRALANVDAALADVR